MKPIRPAYKQRTNSHKISKKRKLERRKIRRFIKRHRNSIINHTFNNNSHISAFDPSKMSSIPLPPSLIGLPGCDWVLENYRLCQTWQLKQNNAMNKVKLASLEYENERLRERLQELMKENHMLKNNSHLQPHIQVYNKKKHQVSIQRKENTEEVNYEDNDEYFEIDDEFKKFFKETLRHRDELKKNRKQQVINQENDKLQDFRFLAMKQAEREELYQRLYGEDGPMIRGMETALKLTFERNLEHNHPTMWPIVSFINP